VYVCVCVRVCVCVYVRVCAHKCVYVSESAFTHVCVCERVCLRESAARNARAQSQTLTSPHRPSMVRAQAAWQQAPAGAWLCSGCAPGCTASAVWPTAKRTQCTQEIEQTHLFQRLHRLRRLPLLVARHGQAGQGGQEHRALGAHHLALHVRQPAQAWACARMRACVCVCVRVCVRACVCHVEKPAFPHCSDKGVATLPCLQGSSGQGCEQQNGAPTSGPTHYLSAKRHAN